MFDGKCADVYPPWSPFNVNLSGCGEEGYNRLFLTHAGENAAGAKATVEWDCHGSGTLRLDFNSNCTGKCWSLAHYSADNKHTCLTGASYWGFGPFTGWVCGPPWSLLSPKTRVHQSKNQPCCLRLAPLFKDKYIPSSQQRRIYSCWLEATPISSSFISGTLQTEQWRGTTFLPRTKVREGFLSQAVCSLPLREKSWNLLKECSIWRNAPAVWASLQVRMNDSNRFYHVTGHF